MVEAGKTAFIIDIVSNINKNEDIVLRVMSTIGANAIFAERFALSIYQDTFERTVKATLPLPEKTDLNFKVISTNTNAVASISIQLLVLDN